MSGIDTCRKYNLHSAVPYIGEKCPDMQKSTGKRPGGGVREKCRTPSIIICRAKHCVLRLVV